MQEQEIYEQLKGIYSNILKREITVLNPDTTAADIDGWDSLTHMILMDNVEKHFGIKFKLMDIMKFNNIGDMVACVQKKMAK